jgi:beta-phosphoglucomutase-like phosphatase (HAD superfamily)
MKIQAVLWDLDGVLVDTQENHFLSWAESLRDFNATMTREMFSQLFGMNNRGTIEAVMGSPVPDDLVEAISEKKENIFRNLMCGNIHLMPGVDAWLHWMVDNRIPQAIASSAPPENIDQVVDSLNIRSLFQAIVPGYGHPSKPDPWVFQKASVALGVPGEMCLVIEDSIAGVQAAKAIGATCLTVTSTNGAKNLHIAGADMVVHTLEEIHPLVMITT